MHRRLPKHPNQEMTLSWWVGKDTKPPTTKFSCDKVQTWWISACFLGALGHGTLQALETFQANVNANTIKLHYHAEESKNMNQNLGECAVSRKTGPPGLHHLHPLFQHLLGHSFSPHNPPHFPTPSHGQPWGATWLFAGPQAVGSWVWREPRIVPVLVLKPPNMLKLRPRPVHTNHLHPWLDPSGH